MPNDKIELTKTQLVELLKEVSAETVKTQLDAQVKELGLNDLGNKFARLNPGTSVEELNKLNGKEKTAKFIKALYNKDVNELSAFKKAMNETTGSAGAFLVPEEFTAEVYRVMEDYGLVAKLATRFPMGSDTRNIPTVGSSVTGSYPGEATAGTASQPVLAQVQLLAKTWIGLTVMSNELLADANVSVVDLLVELFAEAIAGELDDQALTGSGSPFTGITGDASVNITTMSAGNTTFSNISIENLKDLRTSVKAWSLQGAAYIMHRTVWGVVTKLRTGGTNSGDFFSASQNPVTVIANQGFPASAAGFIDGYPVYLSDKMPAIADTAISTKFVIFGNLKHIFFGQRQDLAVDISREGTINSVSLFETNQSALRVISRHSVAVGLPTAFAVLRTAAA